MGQPRERELASTVRELRSPSGVQPEELHNIRLIFSENCSSCWAEGGCRARLCRASTCYCRDAGETVVKDENLLLLTGSLLTSSLVLQRRDTGSRWL